MITIDNIKQLLSTIGFYKSETNDEFMSIYFENIDASITVDFTNEKIIYPEGVGADRDTTKNFSKNENFVVLECVVQLFKIGYLPQNIVLEPKTPGGREDSFYYGDILVKNNDNRPYLLIECKTTEGKNDDEFSKAWNKTKQDGGQLFNYHNTYRQAEYLCLYTSDFVKDEVKRTYYFIQMNDIDEIIGGKKHVLTYKKVREDLGGKEAYFKVWAQTYDRFYDTHGIFEESYLPFCIGQKRKNIESLDDVGSDVIDKKYHLFRETLRKYNVASHENAFDKLVNLFLAKIVDEQRNPEDLQFCWKGKAHDDYYRFQDRLQKLYKIGMEEYLNEIVTYVDDNDVENAFHLHKNEPDAIKEKIIDYFHQIKFYSNSDFGFLDVHNEELFRQNSVILKEMVEMLQDIKIRDNKQPQFLGNLFENFLDQGVRQNEGQFFTPVPIARFMVSSLPLQELLEQNDYKPNMIDYACGAGHFLTEYATQTLSVLKAMNKERNHELFHHIYGIEKEYRLSKVSKISSFMYNQEGINIIYGDALLDYSNISEGTFDVLVANPPFRVTGFLQTLPDDDIRKYSLSEEVAPSNYRSFNNIEYFFVEKAKNLLSENGVAAIILPNTIRTDSERIAVKTREIILRYFDIIGIVELTSKTFGKTGTETTVLFLKKRPEDVAKYAKQRAESWFNNDHSQDYRYKDQEVINDYCDYIGITREDLDSLIQNTPTEELKNSEFWDNYVQNLIKSAAYKKIIQKPIKENYTRQQREDDAFNYILKEIRNVEKEKLEFFILATYSKKGVVVVKMPNGSVAEKEFLGYEWSNAKNNEGAHVLGIEESKDPDQIQAKGWDRIVTPLYNPTNLLDDPLKINHLIKQNFSERLDENSIPSAITGHVKYLSLNELIDFETPKFDKSIGTESIMQYPEIQTSLPVEKLGKIAPFVTSRISASEFETRNYISTENMLQNRAGIEKYDSTLSIGSLTEYKKGDILVSNIRPYLKKIWIADCDGGCSNDVLVFRSQNESISPEYLYCILSSNEFFDFMMVGKTGTKMPRGNKRVIPRFNVPLLNPEQQPAFAKEIMKVEKKYESIKNITGKRLKLGAVKKQFDKYEEEKQKIFGKYLNPQ